MTTHEQPGAEQVQDQILRHLNAHQSIKNTMVEIHSDSQMVLGILKSLASRSMIVFEPHESFSWVLLDEGKAIADHGSHEVKVFESVPPGPEGIALSALQNKWADVNVLKIGQGKAFKNKWIRKDGDRLVRLVDSVQDQTRGDLQQIQQTGTHRDEEILKDLKKRKLCDRSKTVYFSVQKGPQFSMEVRKQATDITADSLVNEAWKSMSFKRYNFDTAGIPPSGGYLHPLMKVREEFRQIFFEMGFEEMPTNKYVESSFWNFDALFQPQDHPARDMHDTFFIKSPASTDSHPEDYLERVKQIHSKGGYGSVGYGYEWNREEAEKLILRTHTTAVSSYMLYKLAQEPHFRPVKYFSIDRVFRNESVDATHLAEFHQVEGLIADENLTLGDLIGFLDIFFKKLGVTDLRFKPTYNPYTEPSLEVFSYHKGLKKWVEVGNSGMFRPEMLLPLGLPSNVRVIAWGLSLERPTMIKYGIDNIRDLLGHKVSLEMIKSNPICRLDKKMGREAVGLADGIAGVNLSN